MILCHHLIWTAYGWWLPNDPRGSMSHEIRSDIIGDLGAIHHGRKRVQPAGRDVAVFYERARESLKHTLMEFTSDEIAVIADAFGRTVARRGYTCYACAIMHDHVHIAIRKHRDSAEAMIGELQNASKLALHDSGLRAKEHPVWGGPGWKVFLDSRDDIERTIRYIEENPIKRRLSAQRWGFVAPYDGWPQRMPASRLKR